jgi:hypothetical protein
MQRTAILFHLDVQLPGANWVVYVIHGNHHENPGDPLRSLMPFLGSLPFGTLVWAACVGVAGFGRLLAVFWASPLGYVIYDAGPLRLPPMVDAREAGAALKTHHMRHHYVDEHGNFCDLCDLLGSRVRLQDQVDRRVNDRAAPPDGGQACPFQ